jgi:hypothetical protein
VVASVVAAVWIRSTFFFEKKNQKTFETRHTWPGERISKVTKVFCFFSSEKKTLTRKDSGMPPIRKTQQTWKSIGPVAASRMHLRSSAAIPESLLFLDGSRSKTFQQLHGSRSRWLSNALAHDTDAGPHQVLSLNRHADRSNQQLLFTHIDAQGRKPWIIDAAKKTLLF